MKKFIAGLLSFLFILSPISSVISHAEELTSEKESVVNLEIINNNDDYLDNSITDNDIAEIEARANAIIQELEEQPRPSALSMEKGIKSKAVIKVAQLMKAGGDEVIDLARTFNIIDAKTAKTMSANSSKIGKFLDTLSNAGDNAAAMARNQLPNYLIKNTNMSKGTAENIAIAISWAIRGADWLFL